MNKVIQQNLMPIQFRHHQPFKAKNIPSTKRNKFGIWKKCCKIVKIQVKGTTNVEKKNSLHCN
jgi:hypothetical protein